MRLKFKGGTLPGGVTGWPDFGEFPVRGIRFWSYRAGLPWWSSRVLSDLGIWIQIY